MMVRVSSQVRKKHGYHVLDEKRTWDCQLQGEIGLAERPAIKRLNLSEGKVGKIPSKNSLQTEHTKKNSLSVWLAAEEIQRDYDRELIKLTCRRKGNQDRP